MHTTKRFQFSLKALFTTMTVAAVAAAGLAALSPQERIMAIAGPIYICAWHGFWDLPIALIVVCFTTAGRARRKAAAWMLVAWAICCFLMTGPLGPHRLDALIN